MFEREKISIGNILLDLSNYRHGIAGSQKEARDAIIAEQGRKLAILAKDIAENGLNPFDLPLVIYAEDGNKNYIVIEGNRRITSINLMMKPELAEGTSAHAAFKRLNKNYPNSIPKVIDCVVAPNKQSGLLWINRKHSNGLEGAGTEPWSSVAKARADAEQGKPRPDLDAVNFVLANKQLDPAVRKTLEGSKFNLSTLERILTTSEAQNSIGFSVQDGKLVSDQDQQWIKEVMTEIVTIIATSSHKGKKFTERDIDSQEKRTTFSSSIISNHPGKKKSDSPWQVSGKPKTIKPPTKPKPNRPRPTTTTDDRITLVPKGFKLSLPSGKINDIFSMDLKKLHIVNHRHAVSVLFRVFFEFTLEDYISKHGISLPTDNRGRPTDSLKTRLTNVVNHCEQNKVLTKDELKPIKNAISNKNALVASDTLNAYVHSKLLNPDPMELKITWNNVELFIQRLWGSKK